jgi:uncharacterized membrane protein
MTEPTEPQKPKRNSGMLVAIGAILGVGIGAAVGTAMGEMSTGIWIGAVIGVGLGMLGMFLTS